MSEPATSNEVEKPLLETVYCDSMSLAIVPRNTAETAVERNYAAWARTRRAKSAQFILAQRTDDNRTKTANLSQLSCDQLRNPRQPIGLR